MCLFLLGYCELNLSTLFTWNIAPVYGDVVVSIRPCVLVEESQGVHDLVSQTAPAAGVAHVDVVFAQLHAQWGGAHHAFPHEINVVSLTFVWYHSNAGLGLVLEHDSSNLVPLMCKTYFIPFYLVKV